MRRQVGFTLFEVMIALFIMSIAIGSTVKIMGSAASNSSRLVDRTFSNWIALNRITDLRLKSAWPKLGEVKGDDDMSGRNWKWIQKTIKTDDDSIRRVEVSVWPKSDKSNVPYITLVGFLSAP